MIFICHLLSFFKKVYEGNTELKTMEHNGNEYELSVKPLMIKSKKCHVLKKINMALCGTLDTLK